tara:strand:- start:17 stop:319 length:303 start_codon:yes stop_codon:yes gene_type:complete
MDLKLLMRFCETFCKIKKFLCFVIYVVIFYIKIKIGIDKKGMKNKQLECNKLKQIYDRNDRSRLKIKINYDAYDYDKELIEELEYGQYCDIEICENGDNF